MKSNTALEKSLMSEKRLVLASDLDGTFLGGSDEARAKFYGWLEDNRAHIGLIFVTGRDPEFVTHLTRADGVPTPDYAICDVGTTIAMVNEAGVAVPIAELETEIAEAWSDAADLVKSALSGVKGLTLQPTDFRYRVSYDLDPEIFDPRAKDLVAELGMDHLISDNRFFDVLPRGVSKGPSLLRLIRFLNIEAGRCLVAGDTLNDLSMLELGLPAVAVGNSETGLLEHVENLEHVHVAEGEGASGIAEAIRAFNFFQIAAA